MNAHNGRNSEVFIRYQRKRLMEASGFADYNDELLKSVIVYCLAVCVCVVHVCGCQAVICFYRRHSPSGCRSVADAWQTSSKSVM